MLVYGEPDARHEKRLVDSGHAFDRKYGERSMTRRPITQLFGTQRPHGLQAGAVAVPLLVAFMLGGTAAFAHLHVSSLEDTRTEQASDGATILALEGLHAFEEGVDPEALMTLPVGADSMVMKARVFGGGRSMGTYTVSLKRVARGGFRVLATGRLVSGERSTMCSFWGQVDLAGTPGDEIAVGYDTVPLCNGKRHRSALTTQLRP